MELDRLLTKLPLAKDAGTLGAALREVPATKKNLGLRMDLVFALLSSSATAVLVCEDDPAEMDEPEGTWAAVGPGAWRLPEEEFDLGSVLDWLSAGNWSLVGFADAKSVREFEPIDLFAEPEASAAALRAVGATWAIDVFHDDAEWRVLTLA